MQTQLKTHNEIEKIENELKKNMLRNKDYFVEEVAEIKRYNLKSLEECEMAEMKINACGVKIQQMNDIIRN